MSSPTEAVNGMQGEGVISTLKHYTLNCNETNRHWLDAIIDPNAHRESDLLAFQIAIERSQPSSIMCGYNKINGEYACGKITTCLTRCSKTLGATQDG
jgi:beta-glucosidase